MGRGEPTVAEHYCIPGCVKGPSGNPGHSFNLFKHLKRRKGDGSKWRRRRRGREEIEGDKDTERKTGKGRQKVRRKRYREK